MLGSYKYKFEGNWAELWPKVIQKWPFTHQIREKIFRSKQRNLVKLDRTNKV